jgi:hypothetical protein
VKTVITDVEQHFDFLGQNVRRYCSGKLLIKLSKQSIHTFLEKVRKVVKKPQAYHMAVDRKPQSDIARLRDVSPS